MTEESQPNEGQDAGDPPEAQQAGQQAQAEAHVPQGVTSPAQAGPALGGTLGASLASETSEDPRLQRAQGPMLPSVGRIVHFVFAEYEQAPGREFCAAVVTQVHDVDCIDLRLFVNQQPGGPIDEWRTSVPHESGIPEGNACWRWPILS